MTVIIGITGGIGSGKSTFSKEAIKRKFKLIDSDQDVSYIYKNPKKEFLDYLKKIGLGESVRNKNINKQKISKIIFSQKKIRLKLENYIFKKVRKNRSDFIKNEKRKKTKIIFCDIPLLFENNLEDEFDKIISIISSQKQRYKRLLISKKISKTLKISLLNLKSLSLIYRYF